MLSFFPRGVLDEILNLIESVSEGFPSYSYIVTVTSSKPAFAAMHGPRSAFDIGHCTVIHCNAMPGCVAQSVGHLTRKPGVLGSIPGLATYFRFSFRFFKKGSCQLLAKVCARSTG